MSWRRTRTTTSLSTIGKATIADPVLKGTFLIGPDVRSRPSLANLYCCYRNSQERRGIVGDLREESTSMKGRNLFFT
jgi:hypothetical protein